MTKRNPCRYLIETFDETGHLIKTWRRGYAQERKTIDGVEMTFVMEGGDTGLIKPKKSLVKNLFGIEAKSKNG